MEEWRIFGVFALILFIILFIKLFSDMYKDSKNVNKAEKWWKDLSYEDKFNIVRKYGIRLSLRQIQELFNKENDDTKRTE